MILSSASRDDGQAKFVEEAINGARQQAFFMKRALDGDDLATTLKHASEMLRELRTSLLSPKNYYSLCRSLPIFQDVDLTAS